MFYACKIRDANPQRNKQTSLGFFFDERFEFSGDAVYQFHGHGSFA
jgi:hypothetical protein